MECEQVQEMLADYLGDELNSSGRVTFESHLETCPQCRREFESLQTTLRCLEQLTGPPVTMADALSGRRSRVPALRRYALRALAYAATLAIGVGIGWFAKPALSDSGKAIDLTLPKTGHSFVAGIQKGQVPNQFVSNAVALSTAFSQPFGG